MSLEMFEDSNEGFHLRHPPLSLRSHLIVEAAICAAWELMRNRGRAGFVLKTADEDVVTHELYERLYDEVFDKGVVDGFDREIFASVHREPKVRNFNGSNLDKMPDLLVEFIDRPIGAMNSQHGLFIECKPVDRQHPAGSAYCDAGLIRFVRGDYAWAMQNAMMVGYAQEGHSLIPKLSEALATSRKEPIPISSGPACCPHTKASPFAERVAISEHLRTFNYVESNVPAGIIVIRHLRLRAGTAFLAARRAYDHGARAVEANRARLHHQAPLASLLRVCGNSVEVVSYLVLIGVSGSGKSTFAWRHFRPTEILSSDYCRGLVSDDENSQMRHDNAMKANSTASRVRCSRAFSRADFKNQPGSPGVRRAGSSRMSRIAFAQ